MSYALKFSKFLYTLNRYVQYLHKDVDSAVLQSYDIALQNMRALPESKQESEYVRLVSDLAPLFAECQAAIAASLSADSDELDIPLTVSTGVSRPESEIATSPSSSPTLAPACAGAQTGTETGEGKPESSPVSDSESDIEASILRSSKPKKLKKDRITFFGETDPVDEATIASLKERISHISVGGSESYAVADNPPIGTPMPSSDKESPSSVDDAEDIEFDEDGDCVDFGYIDDSDLGEVFLRTDADTGQTKGFGEVVDQNELPESLVAIDDSIRSIDSIHRHIRRIPAYVEARRGHFAGKAPERFVEKQPVEKIDTCIKLKPIEVYCYLDNISEDAMKTLMDMLLSIDRRRLAYNEFPLLMQWFRSRKRLYSVHNLSEKDGRYKSGGIPLDEAHTYKAENPEDMPTEMDDIKHHVGMKKTETDVNNRTYALYRRKEIIALMDSMYGHDDTWSGYDELNEKDIVNWNREFNAHDTYAVDGKPVKSVLTKEQILRHRQSLMYLERANLEYAHRLTDRTYKFSYVRKGSTSIPWYKHSSIVYNERLESLNTLFIPAELRKPLTFVAGSNERIPYKDKLELIGSLALLSMDDKLVNKDMHMLKDDDIIKLYHLAEFDTATIVDALDSLPKKNLIALYYRLLCMMLDSRFMERRQWRYSEINNRMVEFDNLALNTVTELCGESELESFAGKYKVAMAMFTNEYAKSQLGIDGDILELQKLAVGVPDTDMHKLSIAFSVIGSMNTECFRGNNLSPLLNGKSVYDDILDDYRDEREHIRDFAKLNADGLRTLDSMPWPKEAPNDADIMSGVSSSIMDTDAPLDIGKQYDNDTLEMLKAFSDDFRRFYIGLDRSGVLTSAGYRNQATLRSLADRIMAFSSKIDMYRTATSSDADRKYAEGEKIYKEHAEDVPMVSTGAGKIRLTEEDILDGRIRHTKVVDDPDYDFKRGRYKPGTLKTEWDAMKERYRAMRKAKMGKTSIDRENTKGAAAKKKATASKKTSVKNPAAKKASTKKTVAKN